MHTHTRVGYTQGNGWGSNARAGSSSKELVKGMKGETLDLMRKDIFQNNLKNTLLQY